MTWEIVAAGGSRRSQPSQISAASLRRLLRDEGFAPIADLGRGHGARVALSQFHAAPTLTALRIGKRLLAAEASTQLVCRLI